MKTVGEFLYLLDDLNYKKAINYASDKLNYPSSSLKHSLSVFDWDKTKEGWEYWANIYIKHG